MRRFLVFLGLAASTAAMAAPQVYVQRCMEDSDKEEMLTLLEQNLWLHESERSMRATLTIDGATTSIKIELFRDLGCQKPYLTKSTNYLDQVVGGASVRNQYAGSSTECFDQDAINFYSKLYKNFGPRDQFANNIATEIAGPDAYVTLIRAFAGKSAGSLVIRVGLGMLEVGAVQDEDFELN